MTIKQLAPLSPRCTGSPNSKPFLELVEQLTGAPLTGGAWVADLEVPLDVHLEAEKVEFEKGLAVSTERQQADASEVDLSMKVMLCDGDEVIADSETDGGFSSMCGKFSRFVAARLEQAAAKA